MLPRLKSCFGLTPKPVVKSILLKPGEVIFLPKGAKLQAVATREGLVQYIVVDESNALPKIGIVSEESKPLDDFNNAVDLSNKTLALSTKVAGVAAVAAGAVLANSKDSQGQMAKDVSESFSPKGGGDFF